MIRSKTVRDARDTPPPEPEKKPDISEAIVGAMQAIAKVADDNAESMREVMSKISENQTKENPIVGLKIIPELDKKSIRYGLIKEVVFMRKS